MFKTGSGYWKQYQTLPSLKEIDFHYGDLGPREVAYESAMGDVYSQALNGLQEAYREGVQHVLFTHGSSTSRNGMTTARSVVRGLMRSTEATPYIIRKECIQYESVFVAVIRPQG